MELSGYSISLRQVPRSLAVSSAGGTSHRASSARRYSFISSPSDNNQRREFEELLARAAEDDQSGAFGLFDFLKTGAKIIGGLIGGRLV